MTGGVIVLVIFGLFVALVVFAGGRLIWGLFRGDLQIEPSTFGTQFRRRRDQLDEDSD